MNISGYINTINDINLVIENLSKKDVQKNISSVSNKVEKLTRKIHDFNKRQNSENSPYSEIILDFFSKVTLSVRSADIKTENIFEGRQTFDVVGFGEDYFILRDKDWDFGIALKLTYSKLTTRISQKGELKLFYNNKGDYSNINVSRSSEKQLIMYEIINLK